MPDNVHQCSRCEAMFPEEKLNQQGKGWTCKGVKGCVKRRAALIKLTASEEPHDGRRDSWSKKLRPWNIERDED